MGQVRLFPLVAVAACCLFVLKMAGLLFSGGYVLSGAAPAQAQLAEPGAEQVQPDQKNEEKKTAGVPAQDLPGKSKDDAPGKPEKPSAKKLDMSGPPSGPLGAEYNVLKKLVARRNELNELDEKLKMREHLLKAAEKQIEGRIAKLKEIEKRIGETLKKQEAAKSEQFMRLVKMYSNMKPKEAARIFDRLDLDVLMDLVQQMKPRKMSAILAKMNANKAELLTIKIANQKKPETVDLDDLPKLSPKNPG